MIRVIKCISEQETFSLVQGRACATGGGWGVYIKVIHFTNFSSVNQYREHIDKHI